jgi:hypothetical protein
MKQHIKTIEILVGLILLIVSHSFFEDWNLIDVVSWVLIIDGVGSNISKNLVIHKHYHITNNVKVGKGAYYFSKEAAQQLKNLK